jgi:uncharacterized membrane protein
MKQALVFIVLFIILLSPAEALAASDHIEYHISVNRDGSASWTIIQATDINSTVDSCEQFEQRLLSIINNAKEHTGRDMALNMSSLQIKDEIHWETSSQTIEYSFQWENFSTAKEGKITLGDVFDNNLFSKLYGDGELWVTYPQGCSVSSASPPPNEQTNSSQTLRWYRTQDFISGKPDIVITEQYEATNAGLPLTALAIVGSGALGAVAIGFLLLNLRRNRKQSSSQTVALPQWQDVEDNKEKILQLLKFSGGSMKQSEICTKLKFSRTKTSLLLAEMEKNTQVRRTKKGRNKIVYIEKGTVRT